MDDIPPTLPAPAYTLTYTDDELKQLARQWTKAMWNAGLWKQVRWMGVPVLQWPTDLMLMQELVSELRPKFIIETGLYQGGTAVYYASLLHLLGIDGRVISIDIHIQPEARRNISGTAYGDRILMIEGDSNSEAVHQELERQLVGETNVLVCLDSDHSFSHTLAELRNYSRYIPVGGYMVLSDTICEELADAPGGNASWKQDSPMAALREFLKENPAFVSDPRFDKYLVSFSPRGFLKKIR